MSEQSKAIFVSYASEDAETALKLCNALRAASIEVWFDQSELRGGDTWDASIRRQIKNCALFLAIISRNTHQRREGYFRLEWKLAVDRSHLMDAGMAFLLPVVIDDTKDNDERVPDRFREVQWTRLPQGANTDAFVEHVRCLLSGDRLREPSGPTQVALRVSTTTTPKPIPPFWRSKWAFLVTIAGVLLALGYLVANRIVFSKHGAEVEAARSVTKGSSTSGFNPPPHSIAVLPFANMSGDKEQEYFSDGLTEELLNSLSEINELEVAARTSAFSFKGKDTDIGTIARKLNVGTVLEGSVRRSEHTIRITAQLINAVTGFHLWSKTYDRDLGDVLKLQTEIAAEVASALKVTLLSDVSARIELGGTHNAAALDAYLRGAKASSAIYESKDLPKAIAAYTEAVRLDPHYALAFAARSMARSNYTAVVASGAAIFEGFDNARADARQALILAPGLAEAHLALGLVSEYNLDFTQGSDAYERALALAPGNTEVLGYSGIFAVFMGHIDAGLAALRRAVVLDPLTRGSHFVLGQSLYLARRYEEAVAAFAEVIRLEPEYKETYGRRGFAYYALGNLQSARTSCETKPEYWVSQQCLAVIYDRLGRHADAEGELSKLKAAGGDDAAYQYATIYAQWGNRLKALEWLETALRLRDTGLAVLRVDPLLDPLRQEPRFQAIERQLKFPD